MQKGDRAVKEITVKELMEMAGSDICQTESVDRHGIYIRMKQVNIIYDEDKVVLQDGFNQAIGSAIKWIERYMSNS